MRTLMLLVSFGLLLSGSASNAGGDHDHGPKHSGSGYPRCTIHYCPPAYPSYGYGYRPYYRTNRRFSVQVSWGGAYGGYRAYGYGAGYAGYGGYGYRPYNPYPTYQSNFSGVTYLPFGSVMYY